MVWDVWLRCLGWAFFLVSWIPFASMFWALLTNARVNAIFTALGQFILLCVLFAVFLTGSFLSGDMKRKGYGRRVFRLKQSFSGSGQPGPGSTTCRW